MDNLTPTKMFAVMEELYPDLDANVHQKKPKYQLQLSVTRTWGNRTIPTSSPQWRAIKDKVLKRDNFECRFCGLRLSKFIVMDHMDGRADNNDLANFGLNCPLCDKIRHCGLAGIHGDLVVRVSSIPQVDIIRNTQAFFKKNGYPPKPEEIDPHCVRPSKFDVRLKNGQIVHRFIVPDLAGEYSSIEFANVLMQFDYDDLDQSVLLLKGFFMPKMIYDFLKYEIV